MVLNAHTKGNGIPTTLRYPEPRTQEPEVLKQHIIIACATNYMLLAHFRFFTARLRVSETLSSSVMQIL